MISDPELDKLVQAFLEDGVDRMPDRVYGRAMDVIPTVRRKRGRWWRRRVTFAASVGRLAIAAALVAAVAIGSLSLLSLGGRSGLSPVPSTQPSAAPTAVPSPSPTGTALPTGGPIAGLPRDTVLGAGRYEVGAPFEAHFAITLPADSQVGDQERGRSSFNTPLGSLEIFLPDGVFADPCRADHDAVPVRTVDEVVQHLTSMVGVAATAPATTTVGGRPARSFVLTNTIDTATAGCVGEAMLPLFTYVGNADGAATNGGARQVVWVVDVDGRPMLVIGDGWHDTVRAELEAIVSSITFP